MKRTIYALIVVDDETAFAKIDDGPIPYLEQEFGWLEQSGISLSDAFIADSDDTDSWGRYIAYLAKWVFEHQSCDNQGAVPLTYAQWNQLIK